MELCFAVALFLKAQAHHHQGHRREASEAILNAVKIGASSNREHQGMFMQVCSELTCEQSEFAASRLASRARRVWQERGNASSATHPQIVQYWQSTDAEESKRVTPEVSAFCAVNSLAASFDLTWNPRLFGAELKQLIEDLGCSPGVRIVKRQIINEPKSYEGACGLFLGEVSRRRSVIVLRNPRRSAQGHPLERHPSHRSQRTRARTGARRGAQPRRAVAGRPG